MTNGLKIIIIFDYKILIFVLEIEPRRNWLLIYSIVIFFFYFSNTSNFLFNEIEIY